MAPKALPNAQKTAIILAWFHKTGQAHSLRELEKALPPLGINSMHLKDFLQALVDDNKIRVEKIGSGNWYWSFPSDERKAKEAALSKIQEEHRKASATFAELQDKVKEVGAARANDDEMLVEAGLDRQTLVTRHAELSREVDELRRELATYSEQDPAEMEKVKTETQSLRNDAERYTDQILIMECWLKERLGGDREAVLQFMKTTYESEFDEEEGGLREL